MTPSFNEVGRRLVMRYANPNTRTFSFSKVRVTASNEGLYNLAGAFASIQNEQPSKVSTIITRQLYL